MIGIAIATILTAYISALTLSNHAFAQASPFHTPGTLPGQGPAGKIVAAEKKSEEVITVYDHGDQHIDIHDWLPGQIIR